MPTASEALRKFGYVSVVIYHLYKSKVNVFSSYLHKQFLVGSVISLCYFKYLSVFQRQVASRRNEWVSDLRKAQRRETYTKVSPFSPSLHNNYTESQRHHDVLHLFLAWIVMKAMSSDLLPVVSCPYSGLTLCHCWGLTTVTTKAKTSSWGRTRWERFLDAHVSPDKRHSKTWTGWLAIVWWCL